MLTLEQYAHIVERDLNETFPARSPESLEMRGIPSLQYDSMRYSLLAGGKRLRGAMLLAAVDMNGELIERGRAYARAVEMIHAYSLIHDDLPGMDDDTLRRGKPTNHVVYGVGQAILAGDGLLNMAFEEMLDYALRHPREAKLLRALCEIARGAGVRGMIAGQCLDLQCERGGERSEDMLTRIHLNKTAAMFEYPLRAGAWIGDACDREVAALGAFGRAFGCLFQVVDDILDVEGSAMELGKSAGKDEKSGKFTAVAQYGLDGARKLSDEWMQKAIEEIAPLGEKAEFFRTLTRDMARRTA